MNTITYSQRISARFILLGMILALFPFHVTVAMQPETTPPGRADEQIHIKPQVIAPETLAAVVLQDAQKRGFPLVPRDCQILDKHAKDELQLPWLINSLDRSQTYLGSNGLAQAMNPTSDRAEIERRQQLVKALMNDAHLFNSVTQSLQVIAKSEEDVLTYWNPLDPLSYSVGHLYFTTGPFKNLNQSKFALEAITLFDAGDAFKSLVGALFLAGFFNEVKNYLMSGIHPSGTRVMQGIWKLPNNHNPLWANYMDNYVPGCSDADHKETVINVSIGGTLKDAVLLQDEVWRRQGNVASSFFKPVKEFFFGPQEQKAPAADAQNLNAAEQQAKKAERPFPLGLWGLMIAGTLYEDYQIYKSVKASKAILKQTYQNLEALRLRTIGVADFIKSVQRLEKLIVASPDLQKHLPAHVKKNITLSKNLSPKMKELVALLNTATFRKPAPGKKASIFYQRGKVLYANLLFTKIKHELVPAMQAVAEIDAYCSIARLMKESAANGNKFTFATFTDSTHAYLELDSCWIAVLNPQESVANSMTLGGNKPGKVIITGPNGGGKSTWLKAAGQAVVMAQSWGIVPARKARMSIFDAVRTSLEPAEDLAHGLSKFMAQKESMDKVLQFVHGDPAKVSLVLLDEPYDGTVTDEIARRAGAFFDSVITSNNCLAIGATHIMPQLANEKLYGWYHVGITEPKLGEFKRTFQLKPGLAKRWFDDQAWRGRFIDWLTLEMRNKAIYARTN
jgi:hypothetical protein